MESARAIDSGDYLQIWPNLPRSGLLEHTLNPFFMLFLCWTVGLMTGTPVIILFVLTTKQGKFVIKFVLVCPFDLGDRVSKAKLLKNMYVRETKWGTVYRVRLRVRGKTYSATRDSLAEAITWRDETERVLTTSSYPHS